MVSNHFIHGGRSFGCLLISSPQGHSGKTIVTIGLCNVLKQKGLSIQPFKKGPDFIDPSWLTIAAGRSCHNLDLFLVPKEKIIQMFEQASKETDLAVVEGAMGLYDGLDNHKTTAEIARLFRIPVLLVVNASRITTSIAAMVKGYQQFDPDIHIAGIILNYVSGKRHEAKLRTAIEQHCKIPVVGSIPRDVALNIPERHLGLIPSSETKEAESIVKRIGQRLKPYLDLDRILEIAKEFSSPPPAYLQRKERLRNELKNQVVKAKIGVIYDRVFNFYYPENLEALEWAGGKIIFINSLRERLPGVDGLYIGGGFPEFFLKELEKNRGLRKDIADAVEEGIPIYAECAGLMYLSQKIHWQGRSYEMVGALPAEVRISEKPEGHGYVVAKVFGRNPFFPIGLTIRGHEFHHSKVLIKKGVKFAYQIKRGHGIDGTRDGVLYKNIFASYTHLHALGAPKWAEAFVSLAAREGKFRRRVI